MSNEALTHALDSEVERRLRLDFGDDQSPEYRLVHGMFVASTLLKNLGFHNVGAELNSIASQAGRSLKVLN